MAAVGIVTLAAPSTAAPRVPGSKWGGHNGCSGTAHYFGEPGDRCPCGGLLSAYNTRDRCNLCGGGKKRARRRGAPASAHGTAVTTAAPAPRHNLGEEIEMAARERRDRKEKEAESLAYLQDGYWHTGLEVANAIGVPRGSVSGILGRLVGDGKLESRIPANGGGYRLRQDAAAKAAQMADYDDVQYPENAPATPPAPAPVDAPATDAPEQPANEAPAPTPLTLQAPVPFAGLAWTYLEGVSLSTELRILDDLEALDDAERERVLAYAFTRWPGKLNLIHEVEVRYPSPDKLATKILDVLDRFARNAL